MNSDSATGTITVTNYGMTLLLPDHDVRDPEISIVIPALNERLTIADFVDWCQIGLKEAGVVGEILIVDSSTDDTPQLALQHGARVLRSPKRGLGRAYIDSIPYIRGKFIVMGDADCTYDFRQLSQFVTAFRSGFQFVMGSRFRGYIEPAAMPVLHQYFGTPVTTWILNQLYSTQFSDIHCGMRGITKEALEAMQLESQSWEYASEMVLKSVSMRLRTTEVPVRFLKDREGRLSHMKRGGFLEPWRAGWINLRAMFIYGAAYFVLRPGLVVLALGLILMLPLTFGPLTIGPITFSLFWMLLGLCASIVGLQSFYFGCIAQVISDLSGQSRGYWLKVFPYTRTMVLSGLMLLTGAGLIAPLVIRYMRQGLSLPGSLTPLDHFAVTGLFLSVAGFTTFVFMLILHVAALRTRYQPNRPSLESAL
jgi:hypothetical protein